MAMRNGWSASWLGLACLMYIVMRPVSSNYVLYPTLAVLAGLGVLELVSRRQPLPRPEMMALLWCIAFAIAGAALIGSFRSNPGLAQQLAAFGGGLIIWGSWAASMDYRGVRRVLTAVMVGAGVLSTLILLYVGQSLGYIPAGTLPEGLLEEQGAGFDGSGTGPAVRFYGLSTLVIAAPMAAAGAILPRSRNLPPRRLSIIVAVLAVAAAMVGGRRAIAIVTICTPGFVWAARWAVGRHRARVAVPRGLVVAAPFLGIAAIWPTIWAVSTPIGQQVAKSLKDAALLLGILEGGPSPLDSVRATQANELIEGWSKNPLLGAGLGAELQSGFTRSERRSWAFELQYHQMLFNMGIVGALFIAGATVIAVLMVRRASRRRPDFAPALVMSAVGALSLVIANATNPYLQAVGHQWGVALVVAIAHAALRAPSLNDNAPTIAQSRTIKGVEEACQVVPTQDAS